MKFLVSALVLTATAMALPSGEGAPSGDKVPVGHGMTLDQAQAKCGNDAKVQCCNKVTYTKDITTFNTGILASVLQNALGGGPGGDGLGLFGQCVPVLNVVGGGVDQLVNQKCKQNIACCQNTKSEANHDLVGVALPCVALGFLL